MYEQFFGFRERPFDLTPNPKYLVLTESHREALSNLYYGIASRKGITLLVGEAGSGKTTVIRAAIDRQPEKVHCVHMHNPTLSRVEFVEMLAAHFQLSEAAGRSKAVLLLELETLLKQRHEAGETTVLVIDEAQSLPLNLLEEIRLLANIETNEQKLVSVIIAGQPELADRLNNQALRQLKQRVALRCELRPLDLSETAGYIAGRIQAAGGVDIQVFTREAVALIHERSQGLPRMISVIADNALLGGFAAGKKPVDHQIVLDVCKDFDLGPRAPAPAPAVRPVREGASNWPARSAPGGAGGRSADPGPTGVPSSPRGPAVPSRGPGESRRVLQDDRWGAQRGGAERKPATDAPEDPAATPEGDAQNPQDQDLFSTFSLKRKKSFFWS